MQKQIEILERLIGSVPALVLASDEKDFSNSPDVNKWSKKQILGHLCDSAFNNIQRFIRTQYESEIRIVYDQNQWVKLQNYQSMLRSDVLILWLALNKQILTIWKHMDHVVLSRTCDTGSASIQIHTLHFIIEDYNDHLIFHLRQIVALKN